MRTAPWMIVLVVAATGCTASGGNPAPVPTAPSAPVAGAQHEMKKITPSASYPLTTCVVSGEDLGAMDDRVAYSYDGTEVQFCCPGCVGKFKKDPAPYLAKISSAAK